MGRPAFGTIREALSQPVARYFWLARADGCYQTGDPASFYSQRLDDANLTFDISNNKALACIAPGGAIRNLVFYRGNARVDSTFPGMWVSKLFSSEGPYAFKIRLGDRLLDLTQVDWPYRSGLLDNFLPITEMRGGQMKITLITFAPLSADGARRLRCVIYGALVENLTGETLEGGVLLPKVKSQITWSLDDENSYMAFVDCSRDPVLLPAGQEDGPGQAEPMMPFCLAPGQSTWVPVVICAPGEPAIDEVMERGTLAWLNDTWAYYRSLTGRLTMPDDGFAASFFERSVHQSLQCIGMDSNGCPTGSDLGTSPTTEVICMKDLYYAYLPLCFLEPDVARAGILWFLEYSLRPPGNKHGAGGVRHSLSISLAPLLMAGLYYESTGDRAFFDARDTRPGSVRRRLERILEQVLRTRPDGETWLFPSRFISDGPSVGDYHTGSNVCAWYAFESFARILGEVYGEPELARDHKLIAARIKASIESRITLDGPFGRQYNEGVNSDGTWPVLGHEGEENDTTLMPVYGYKEYDDPIYRNYMRFSASEYNRFYSPHLRGIKFAVEQDAITEATFPGYVTAFANVSDAASMSGPDGYLTEIRRHTDIDGSAWWWPYFRHGSYGTVIRLNPEISLYPGKCGWGSGVFGALFIDQILGLRYDAPTRTLRFRPFSPSSDFTWDDFRLGSGWFSASLERRHGEITITATNQNSHGINLALEVLLPAGNGLDSLETNDPAGSVAHAIGSFLDLATVRIDGYVLPGETRWVKVKYGA